MKFLCPSCKAKYQIGDEKVAGRSVRMKCRKCGHVIQVSSVAGVGDALPGSEAPPAMDAPSDADLLAAAPAVTAAAPAVPTSETALPAAPHAPPTSQKISRPEPPPKSARLGVAVAPGSSPAASAPGASPAMPAALTSSAASTPTTSAPAAAIGGPQVPAASARPSLSGAARGLAPVPARPDPKRPAVAVRPSVSRPGIAPVAKPPVARASLPGPKAPSPARVPTKAAAAGTASTLGQRSTQPEAAAESAAALEVDVEPLAEPPARTSALPRVEPKPVVPATAADLPQAFQDRDFPEEEESTRIADVGALAGAFSRVVVASKEGPSTDSLSMPADEWFVGINGVPVGPIRLSELRSKAASGSVTRESLVWRDGFEDWRPLRTFPELVAIVDESVSSARASLTPFTPSVGGAFGPIPAVTDPFTAAARTGASADAVNAATPDGSRVSGVTGAAVVTDDLEAAGIPSRSGTSPAAWLAVAMALMFGLTIGYVLFNRNAKTEVVVKYVDRPVPGAANSAAAQVVDKPGVDDSTLALDPKSPVKHTAGIPKAAGTGSAEADKGISGLKGLTGLGSLSPTRGPDSTGPSGAVSGTGQLDSGQIQSTVARYTSSVKRACWQPALDTRDKDAPTTARVNVAITVLPSGSVQNAAVNGDPKGYRGLSQCISSRVRGWQFPPSGDTTTVNVPFVFAAQ